MMLRVTLLTVITGVAVLLIGAPRAHADGIFDKLKAFFTSDETVGSATDMAAAALSNEDMIAGLKEALDVGARTVVSQLGRPDGFLKDEAIRIALPKSLQKADQTLSRFGLGALTDGVKERMNRAAEAAVPEAQDLFVIAVRDMSISDAAAILAGPDDAATQYFKSTMGADLRQRMAPIVSASVADAGVIVAAQNAVDKLPLGGNVPNLSAHLTDHVLDGALDGIFYYLAKEEAAIRENPAKRTTALLAKVFE